MSPARGQSGPNQRLANVAELAIKTRGRKGLRELAVQFNAAINAHDLLTYATAIAFRVLFAFAFLCLTAIAFAGVVHLEGIWRHQVGPGVARVVSPNFYHELEHSVDQVLTTRRWWWLSVGLVLTLWQVSSGVRAVMGALDHIYEVEDRRPFWERLAISLGLAGLICIGLALIIAILFLFPGSSSPVLATLLTAIRYLVITGVLMVMVALILRYATPSHIQARWLTAGSVLAVASWLLTSAIFGWYLANFAYRAYQQAFGILSLLIVLMTYLYLASAAFLLGAELDALIVTEARSTGKRRTRRGRPAR